MAENMENTNFYDVVIIGGGVSGCACAWNCAKLGLSTVLIEKKSFLGGSISGGLVVPMMNTDDNRINIDFYKELIRYAQIYDAQITYSDLNKGWFNPELIKIVLDEMLIDAGVTIYFNSDIYDISTTVNASIIEKIKYILTYNNRTIAETYNDKIVKSILIKRNVLSYYVDEIHNDNIEPSDNENSNSENEFYNSSYDFNNLFKKIDAKYFVDASGDAIISELLSLKMQPDNDLRQEDTLRFIMSNIDSRRFSKWLLECDQDRNITNVTSSTNNEFYMTTSYTSDSNRSWDLSDILHTAVANGDLEEEDTQYFQIFGVAKMPGAVAFNCPRIDHSLPYEQKLITGRKAIYRLAYFCKIYLPGFENAYISHIAYDLGVRVTNRPMAVYNYTIDDIINNKQFENIALHSNYPVDIHSNEKIEIEKIESKGYDLPIESLMSADYNNLFTIGKSVGADFKAQSALRVQRSCLSMGEAVSKHIRSLIQ